MYVSMVGLGTVYEFVFRLSQSEENFKLVSGERQKKN